MSTEQNFPAPSTAGIADHESAVCASCGTPIEYRAARGTWVHLIQRFEPARLGSTTPVSSGAHLATTNDFDNEGRKLR